jgi:hypothetical protein
MKQEAKGHVGIDVAEHRNAVVVANEELGSEVQFIRGKWVPEIMGRPARRKDVC